MGRPRKSPRSAPSAAREADAPASAEELEEKRAAFANFCRNPFCGAGLASRVAKYCEDRPNCQRYRAVIMHCAFRRVLARAGAPLAAGERARSSAPRDSNGDAAFSIPRRKRKQPGANNSDSGQQESGANASDASDAREKKKKKTKRHSGEAALLTPASSRSPSPSVNQDALPTEMRVRQWHIQRHVEAMAPADGQQAEADMAATQVGDAGRPTVGRAATAAQAVKQMDIELVPLGASNQAVNLAGGGRYVQSGNRKAGPTLPPPPPGSFRPPLPPKAPPTADNGGAAAAAAGSGTSVAAGSGTSAGTFGISSSVVPPQSFTPVPQVSWPHSNDTSSGVCGTGSSTEASQLPSNSAASSSTVDNSASRAGTTRISASDYLSTRKVQGSAAAATRPSAGANSAPQTTNPQPNPQSSDQLQASRANCRFDSPDNSFSDCDQSTAREPIPPTSYPSAAMSRADYYREPSERPPLARSVSHSDDRNRIPPPPSERLDYRRSHSDTAEQSSASHRDDRYVRSSTGDAYREFQSDYPENSHRELTRYRSLDERARAEEYSRAVRDGDRRSPRRERYEDGFSRDRSLPRESPGSTRSRVDAFGREIRREERDRSTDRSVTRSSTASPSISDAQGRRSRSDTSSSAHGAWSSVTAREKSSPYEVVPPQFSYHDKFVSDLLSVFIRDVPRAIGAVKNETKKPRKMKWYLDYVDRIVKLFGPDVSIDIKENKAVMLVKQREWLVMEDSSTVSLYTRVLHRLLGEALMWRHMREEADYRSKKAELEYGRAANDGITFIQMWNALKTHTSREYIPLEKQVRYFCGARKHHWSFSVGNVEIGSGSHEDKRIAFNFATAASMAFLLKLQQPQPERRPWENSLRDRAQDQTSSKRDDRDDRGRGREDLPVTADQRRSETPTDSSNGHSSGTGDAAPAADSASAITPVVASTVPPAEGNTSSIVGDGQDAGAESDQRAVDEAPSQPQLAARTDGNGVDAADVNSADTADVPGRSVDPRLRRPPTDPRLRHPPLTDPRANGPVSSPRTQGPTSDPRAGAASNPRTQGPITDLRTRIVAPRDPRRGPATDSVAADSEDVNSGGSSAVGMYVRTTGLSEDEMSISEESDLETSHEASVKPEIKPAAEAQDTCHFCAMIRMSKPDAVNAKCFRCQAKAAPRTS